FWVSHHRMFTHLQRYDRGLIWLNILLLLFVALVPFSAAIMDVRHMDSQTAVFYSANLIAIGLLRCTMWYYATRKHRLIGAELGKAFIRTELWRALIPPLGFLIMIPVAIVNPQLAGFSWTAIFLLSLFLSGRKSSGS
ncbi:MAG TPA: TMEM175 family protein, partial [Steroidobacteraceae bacterium]|nr:TMEM175 family protein [Steroidobacteraceae bacterium]